MSGLIAGKKLALAGHEVTVIERNRTLGGRLATHQSEDGSPLVFDYGVPCFTAETPHFKKFVDELLEQELITPWTDRMGYYDGDQLFDINPNVSAQQYYHSTGGIQKIASYLTRWVDLKPGTKAGGLTHIGADRTKKRSWIINLTDISVFECDAVIIATPAPEAYGILQTAQDETPARRIIRHIDEVNYKSAYTVMAAYEELNELPWAAVECDDDILSLMVNEQYNKSNVGRSALVLHSTDGFVRQNNRTGPEEIMQLILNRAAAISQSWIAEPRWKDLHLWKYTRPINPIDEYFLELEMKEAPLALIGDYLGGNSLESAFLSGSHLADYWIEKYSD